MTGKKANGIMDKELLTRGGYNDDDDDDNDNDDDGMMIILVPPKNWGHTKQTEHKHISKSQLAIYT